MFESILVAVLAFIQSPLFATAVAFLIGWAFPQPAVFERLWSLVMSGRSALDRVEEIIDTVDAVLKANGVIPTNAPKLSKDDVSAVMKGKMSTSDLQALQKARMTR
jgi:hypothetical protein